IGDRFCQTSNTNITYVTKSENKRLTRLNHSLHCATWNSSTFESLAEALRLRRRTPVESADARDAARQLLGTSLSALSGCRLKGAVEAFSRWRMITDRSMTVPLGRMTGSSMMVSINGSLKWSGASLKSISICLFVSRILSTSLIISRKDSILYWDFMLIFSIFAAASLNSSGLYERSSLAIDYVRVVKLSYSHHITGTYLIELLRLHMQVDVSDFVQKVLGIPAILFRIRNFQCFALFAAKLL